LYFLGGFISLPQYEGGISQPCTTKNLSFQYGSPERSGAHALNFTEVEEVCLDCADEVD